MKLKVRKDFKTRADKEQENLAKARTLIAEEKAKKTAKAKLNKELKRGAFAVASRPDDVPNIQETEAVPENFIQGMLRCGAKSKKRGAPCMMPAGHRTTHPGVGRCWLHGGASTGRKTKPDQPIDNTITREYQTPGYDINDPNPYARFLSAEDKIRWDQALKADTLFLVNQDIALLEWRIGQMQNDIQTLREKQFTTVEKTEEEGFTAEGDYQKKAKKKASTLGQIQDIQEALTRVMNTRTKYLEIKAKLEEGGPDDGLESLRELSRVIMRMPSKYHPDAKYGAEDEDNG